MAIFQKLSQIFGTFSQGVAIDLGTANTIVQVRGRGVVINEPSVVAIDRRNKQILAIGAEAQRMVGRTPSDIVAIRPLRDGVISDFEVTERMLQYFIRTVSTRTFLSRPEVVIGIPSGSTEVERRAVHDAALNAGAGKVRLLEEPFAAAIGAGLPITEPTGSMIVDIGGGTTEIAVIALGGMVTSRSIRIAGDRIDQDIITYARAVHNLAIGDRTAEEIKKTWGSAAPLEKEDLLTLKGRDLATGLPKTVEITTVELRDAISGAVTAIAQSLRETIAETPPELISDLIEFGIALAGGGALLAGLDQRLSQETRFPTYVVEDPLLCVVQGAGGLLEAPPDIARRMAQYPISGTQT